MTEELLLQKHERMGMDCCIAAAVITAGVTGLVGAGVSAYSANSAASTEANAADSAAQLQEQQYQQNTANQQPYMSAGTSALNTIGQDQANQTGFATPFNPSTYIDTPGYQFQLQQGTNAINNSAAATGGVLNGGTLQALDQYTTGLANTTYGTAYNQYLQNSQQQYNQLYGVASLGESAAGSLGSQNTQAANNAGSDLTSAGNATAAGTVATGNAVNSGLSSIGNAATTYAVLQGLQSTSSYGNSGSSNGATATNSGYNPTGSQLYGGY